MQMTSCEDAGAGRASEGVGGMAVAPLRSTPSMGTKRKHEPSLRRFTRASYKALKTDVSKNTESHTDKRRTRRRLHDKYKTMKERSNDSENAKRDKGRLEKDDQAE